MGACTPDSLEVVTPVAEPTQISGKTPKHDTSADDEIGVLRYILVAGAQLPADLEAMVAAAGGSVVQTMPKVGLAVVKSGAQGFEAKAAAITGIRAVLPDLQLQWIPEEDDSAEQLTVLSPPYSTDDDPYFNLQWGHDAVNAPEAWAAGYRGASALVAVLDTGFDTDHPDLEANVVHSLSKSFVPGESVEMNPALPSSHGSHVAGTIAAADNGVGIIGVAPEANLMLVKVLSDRGSGRFSWIINGILYAADNGADVINMSLGAALPKNGIFVNPDGSTDKIPAKYITDITGALQRAITYANQQGTVVIAAAGNAGNNGQTDGSRVYLPSDLSGVLSISATGPIGWAMNPATDLDVLASYSNFGNKVDFAAPGGNFDLFYQKGLTPCDAPVLPGRPCYAYDMVFSLRNNGGYGWSAGTSMASPHAAGVAALIVGKHGGDIKPAQVIAIMKQSADDIYKVGRDPLSGHGRVNAFRAVTQ